MINDIQYVIELFKGKVNGIHSRRQQDIIFKKSLKYKTSKLIWLLNNIYTTQYSTFNQYIKILSQAQDLLPKLNNQNEFKTIKDVIQHFKVYLYMCIQSGIYLDT